MHTSSVHCWPSLGKSALSTAGWIPPAPSHSFRWQSPGICDDVGVPAGWKLNPQTPLMQVRLWQSVSTPGQEAGVTQGGTAK